MGPGKRQSQTGIQGPSYLLGFLYSGALGLHISYVNLLFVFRKILNRMAAIETM